MMFAFVTLCDMFHIQCRSHIYEYSEIQMYIYVCMYTHSGNKGGAITWCYPVGRDCVVKKKGWRNRDEKPELS
jgi:hypothetical protein